jgi:hypothetical protein
LALIFGGENEAMGIGEIIGLMLVGWLVGGGVLGFILAVIVAIILVAVWSRMVGPRRTTAVGRL